MILYINACVREASRTHRLAAYLLEGLGKKDNVTEIRLDGAGLKPLDGRRLAYRDECLKKRNFDDPIFEPAKQFAAADTIVISAPFWDNAFPALLKIYLENICVSGLTFKYDETGRPVGLCRGKKLYYVVTSGGPHFASFGYDYMKVMAQMMFGIPETVLIAAENLDVIGNDVEEILADTMKKIDVLIEEA